MKLLFCQIAADKGSAVGKENTAYFYRAGKEVPRDFDKAAFLYQSAFNNGYLDATARQGLDAIYSETKDFKKEYPNF